MLEENENEEEKLLDKFNEYVKLEKEIQRKEKAKFSTVNKKGLFLSIFESIILIGLTITFLVLWNM